MGSLGFAVSIHSFVTSVGAYAGFAAIVGLAILVLLHFAQARESAALREQAYKAAQRIEQLEARLAQLVARQPAPPPSQVAAPATAAAAAPARGRVARAAPVPTGVAAASFPWAPAGVAAPALTAATTLIPVGAATGAPPRPAQTTQEPNGPAVASGEMTELRVPRPSRAAAVGARTNGVGSSRGAPAPVGAHAGDGSARGRGVRAGGGGVRAGGGDGRAGGGDGRAGAGESQRSAGRPGGGAPRFLPPEPEPSERAPAGRLIAIVLGVVLVAAAVVAALFATSAIGGKPSSTARHNGGGARAASALHATAFNPRSVTVAVLNGTGTAGLAGRTSKRLTAGGYKPGTVATASDQTQTKTVVGYLPGHRADGVQVATALKLPATSVQPVTSSAQAVACPPPSPCSANVVITVGADLASS